MADMVSIVNGILAEASTEYQARVPAATIANIVAVGSPILTYSPIQNEFLTALLGKIAMQVIHVKTLRNPLAILKNGTIPLGIDIEEIFTNLAEATAFDPTGATLLTQVKPDVKTVYHRRNRTDQFPVTISREQLVTAFTAWGKLEELVTSCINSLYSGDNYNEFIMMKNLVAEAVIGSKIKTKIVTAITDETTGKAFVKAARNAATYFTFAGTSFNTFGDQQRAINPAWAGRDAITWCPREDQVLLIRGDAMTNIDVDVLAQAFNMEKAALLGQIIEVDSFGAASNVVAVLCDRSWFQVWDNLNTMTEFYNPKSMTWTYFWNHWQTYSFSPFANAVAFRTADVDIVAFDAIDTLAAGSAASTHLANAAAVQALLPDYVYADSGLVKVPVTSWTDTDTYTGAAAGTYTFTAVLGALPYGYTNATGGAQTATIDVVVAV